MRSGILSLNHHLTHCLTGYAQHAREGLLKAADLITAPNYVVIKAADEFTDKTVAINEMLLSGM